MMTNQTQQPQPSANTFQRDMFAWRLNRLSAEKHREDVNRELLRRQH